MGAAPADTAWTRTLFRARLWLAARLLPYRIAGKSLSGILALYDPRDGDASPPFPAAYVERSVRWAVRSPLLMRDRRCLRSGLLGYAALRRAGHDPKLHFSVENGAASASRVAAHCWVSLDGEAVVNQPLDGHVMLFTHPEAPTGARRGE